ncbi:hypothetical protein BC629DRAFT_646081 [Irpex lacteus]|nr:hypothetical protein BC629DRAFT_646081 [Irpex lacteus]
MCVGAYYTRLPLVSFRSGSLDMDLSACRDMQVFLCLDRNKPLWMAHNVANNFHAYAPSWNCPPSIHVSPPHNDGCHPICPVIRQAVHSPTPRHRRIDACDVIISASALEKVVFTKRPPHLNLGCRHGDVSWIYAVADAHVPQEELLIRISLASSRRIMQIGVSSIGPFDQAGRAAAGRPTSTRGLSVYVTSDWSEADGKYERGGHGLWYLS